jgi:hypothetical protein
MSSARSAGSAALRAGVWIGGRRPPYTPDRRLPVVQIERDFVGNQHDDDSTAAFTFSRILRFKSGGADVRLPYAREKFCPAAPSAGAS